MTASSAVAFILTIPKHSLVMTGKEANSALKSVDNSGYAELSITGRTGCLRGALRDLLDRIGTPPYSRIDELLPDRWKELRESAGAWGPAP